MNLNKAMQVGIPPMNAGQVGIGQMNSAAIGQLAAEKLAYANQATAPESELAYAARTASESLVMLEKSVLELSERLQVVLEQDTPSPVGPGDRPMRSVTSQIAVALITHAEQTDRVNHIVRNLLRRLVL